MPNGVNTPLTTRIKIKDQHGNVVAEKEVATYAGLLARAHQDELCEIRTELVQIPTDDNQFLCIAKADVKTKRGVFTGIGDASPRNVHAKIVPHLIRMAETRAKARALRDAVNIGLVALEELGDNTELLNNGYNGGSNGSSQGPPNGNGRGNGQGIWSSSRSNGDGMTDAQRRLLYRILAQAGIEGDAATTVITEEAGVPLADIGKDTASWLIDNLRGQYGQEGAHGT